MKKFIMLLVILISFTLHAQVSVIVNKNVADDSIDKTKLGNIYSLVVSSWSDGTNIVVFDNSSDDLRTKFYDFISKDQMALKKEWMKKQLTGQGKAPEKITSDNTMISKVSSTPGAIGFIKSSSVTDKVKVLIEIK